MAYKPVHSENLLLSSQQIMTLLHNCVLLPITGSITATYLQGSLTNCKLRCYCLWEWSYRRKKHVHAHHAPPCSSAFSHWKCLGKKHSEGLEQPPWFAYCWAFLWFVNNSTLRQPAFICPSLSNIWQCAEASWKKAQAPELEWWIFYRCRATWSKIFSSSVPPGAMNPLLLWFCSQKTGQ